MRVRPTLSAGGTTFLRHIGWNLAGQVAPLAAALISIPLLLTQLGPERFGLLAIGWMLVGYFGLFDLGIGRALTQQVSARLATGGQNELPPLIWTGLVAMGGFGLVGVALIMAMSEPAIYRWLKVPVSLRSEALASLYVLAPTVLPVVLATGLRGILEAHQQFRAVNLIRIPSGVLMFAAPLLALPWTNSLVAVFAILLLVRCATLLAMVWTCWRTLPAFRHFCLGYEVLPDLLKFGGWMMVTNLVSPLMVQMDRFFIGAMLSLAAVTHYATPFEMVTKILLVPTAITGVAFPTFARLLAQRNLQEASRMYWRSLWLVGVACLPIVLLPGLLADPILYLWLRGSLPTESTLVMQILLFGIFVNCLAHVPLAWLQGAKRADLTAKIHLAEAPLYAVVLTAAIANWGVVGAASAWSLRVTIDALAMFVTSAVVRRNLAPQIARDAQAMHVETVKSP